MTMVHGHAVVDAYVALVHIVGLAVRGFVTKGTFAKHNVTGILTMLTRVNVSAFQIRQDFGRCHSMRGGIPV